MEFTLDAALSREAALGICQITKEIYPLHSDGTTRVAGPDLLRMKQRDFKHGLLILDFEGSGTSHANALDLEAELDQDLERMWPGGAKAIVIQPELDVWMWGSDNMLQSTLNWPDPQGIRPWVNNRGFSFHSNGKPERPKEAFKEVLMHIREPRSSALYGTIANKISLSKCVDPSFHRLRNQLQTWFPKK